MTTQELVDQYFSENLYGSRVRSRAAMLASEAYELGIETANKIAELASHLPKEVFQMPSLSTEYFRVRTMDDCFERNPESLLKDISKKAREVKRALMTLEYSLFAIEQTCYKANKADHVCKPSCHSPCLLDD